MSLASLCNLTATISRNTQTLSAGAATEDSHSAVYTSIPCTIQPSGGSVIERFARMGMQISHTLYTTTPIALKSGDSVADSTGRTFQVTSFSDQAGRGRVYAAYLLQQDA